MIMPGALGTSTPEPPFCAATGLNVIMKELISISRHVVTIATYLIGLITMKILIKANLEVILRNRIDTVTDK